MKKFLIGLSLFCIVILGLAVTSLDFRRFITLYAQGESDILREVDFDALTQDQQGAYYFLTGDFGGLSTNTLRGAAAPWILMSSAITLDFVEGDLEKVNQLALKRAFQQWGFTSPKTITNWPTEIDLPEQSTPLGFTVGTVARNIPSIEVTTSNIACTACHSNPAYDANGSPDLSTIWLGTPNSSINLEAYPQAIYDSFLKYGDDPKLMQAADILFPNMSQTERRTLTKFILPAAKKRMIELEDSLGRAVPFRGGYPGITNGLDSLHLQLGIQPRDSVAPLSAFNSVPNIDGHMFRTSFLNVANYEIPKKGSQRPMKREDITEQHLDDLGAMAAFFIVPSMGVDPATAQQQIPIAQATMRFIKDVKTQPFPGYIDREIAKVGGTIYADKCSSCHGDYDAKGELSSFPNYVGSIDTDPVRMKLLKSAQTAKAINESIMGDYIQAVDPIGYIAPPLNGIWATAPYLHNGSIPTLAHFFNPDTRPEKFFVGGQKLNFDLIGIDGYLDDQGVWTYPDSYTPWANKALFDTTKKGHSSQGHTMPFDEMTEAEKRALLEYLKTL